MTIRKLIAASTSGELLSTSELISAFEDLAAQKLADFVSLTSKNQAKDAEALVLALAIYASLRAFREVEFDPTFPTDTREAARSELGDAISKYFETYVV